MTKISQSYKDSEPSQVPKDNDKINIAISRRALKGMVKRIMKFVVHSGAQIAISVSVYSLLPSMPSAYPKPTPIRAEQSQPAKSSRPIGN